MSIRNRAFLLAALLFCGPALADGITNPGAGTGTTITGGDCTVTAGTITCTKTNNVAFGVFATGTDAANLTGTVASARLSGSYTGITGLGTLTAGATGAGFTIALTTSTVTGALPNANAGTTAAWTPTANGFTIVGGTSSLTGSYSRVGRMVYVRVAFVAGTSSAGTTGTSNFTGLPFAAAGGGTCSGVSNTANGQVLAAGGYLTSTTWFVPTYSATASVVFSCVYDTNDA